MSELPKSLIPYFEMLSFFVLLYKRARKQGVKSPNITMDARIAAGVYFPSLNISSYQTGMEHIAAYVDNSTVNLNATRDFNSIGSLSNSSGKYFLSFLNGIKLFISSIMSLIIGYIYMIARGELRLHNLIGIFYMP